MLISITEIKYFINFQRNFIHASTFPFRAHTWD